MVDINNNNNNNNNDVNNGDFGDDVLRRLSIDSHTYIRLSFTTDSYDYTNVMSKSQST